MRDNQRSDNVGKTRRVYGYVRVSSGAQSCDSSIDAQLEASRRLCEREGRDLAETYVDRGPAARRDPRPGG